MDDVSFHISEGELLGLVGESGCGKTTLARAVVRLVDATSGILSLKVGTSRVCRAGTAGGTAWIAVILQDPYGSLEPRFPARRNYRRGAGHSWVGRSSAGTALVNHCALETVGLRRNTQNAIRTNSAAVNVSDWQWRVVCRRAAPAGARRGGERPGRLGPGPNCQSASGTGTDASIGLSFHRR